MVENQFFSIKSNWKVLGDADLHRVILEKTQNSKDICIEDLNPDKCICLINSDGDVKSKADLEIKANGFITDVILISEAQVVEVFGVNDEYLFTHTSDFFDDWEDMSVYYTRISLPNIPVCRLKFTRARDASRLWIYGAKVCIQKTGNQWSHNAMRFNMEQINRLLGSSRFKNLKEENNFKNFQQFCASCMPTNKLDYIFKDSPSVLASMRDYSNSSAKSETAGKTSNNSDPSDILSRLNLKGADESQTQVSHSKELFSETFNRNWFASYIDKKFHEVKCDILKEIDAKLCSIREENSSKLDRIISLLENDRIKA